MDWIRDRITFNGSDARSIDDQLHYLEAAAAAGEFHTVTRATVRLRQLLADVRLSGS